MIFVVDSVFLCLRVFVANVTSQKTKIICHQDTKTLRSTKEVYC